MPPHDGIRSSQLFAMSSVTPKLHVETASGEHGSEANRVTPILNESPSSQQCGSNSDLRSDSDSSAEPLVSPVAAEGANVVKRGLPTHKRRREAGDSLHPAVAATDLVQSGLSAKARQRRNARNRRREKRRRNEAQVVKKVLLQPSSIQLKKTDPPPPNSPQTQVNGAYINFLLSSVTSIVTTSRDSGWNKHAYDRVLFLLDEAMCQTRPCLHGMFNNPVGSVKACSRRKGETALPLIQPTHPTRGKSSAGGIDDTNPNRRKGANVQVTERGEQSACKEQTYKHGGGIHFGNEPSRSVETVGENENDVSVQCAKPHAAGAEAAHTVDAKGRDVKNHLAEMKRSLISSLGIAEIQNDGKEEMKGTNTTSGEAAQPKLSTSAVKSSLTSSRGCLSECMRHDKMSFKRKLDCINSLDGGHGGDVQLLETGNFPHIENKSSQQQVHKKTRVSGCELNRLAVETERMDKKQVSFGADTVCTEKSPEVNNKGQTVRKSVTKRRERQGLTSISSILDIARRTGTLQSSKSEADNGSEGIPVSGFKGMEVENDGMESNEDVILVRESLDERIRLYKKAVEEPCKSYSVLLKKADTSPRSPKSLGRNSNVNGEALSAAAENGEAHVEQKSD